MQIDNGRDRVKQLQRQLQERENALKQVTTELTGFTEALEKEKRLSRETTDKIKKLQESYEELKRLKNQVLERKERGLATGAKGDLRTIQRKSALMQGKKPPSLN